MYTTRQRVRTGDQALEQEMSRRGGKYRRLRKRLMLTWLYGGRLSSFELRVLSRKKFLRNVWSIGSYKTNLGGKVWKS